MTADDRSTPQVRDGRDLTPEVLALRRLDDAERKFRIASAARDGAAHTALQNLGGCVDSRSSDATIANVARSYVNRYRILNDIYVDAAMAVETLLKQRASDQQDPRRAT